MRVGALQVLSACLYPELLTRDSLPADVRQRAQRILGECDGGSVGMLLLCDFKFAATHTCSLAHLYGAEPRTRKCKPPFFPKLLPSSADSSAAPPVILKCKDFTVILGISHFNMSNVCPSNLLPEMKVKQIL